MVPVWEMFVRSMLRGRDISKVALVPLGFAWWRVPLGGIDGVEMLDVFALWGN